MLVNEFFTLHLRGAISRSVVQGGDSQLFGCCLLFAFSMFWYPFLIPRRIVEPQLKVTPILRCCKGSNAPLLPVESLVVETHESLVNTVATLGKLPQFSSSSY